MIGRGASVSNHGWNQIHWDGETVSDWAQALEGVDAVVHLAGKRVDCRPTPSNIDELISSREGTVRLVGEAIRMLDTPPTAWVQLSSLAIFGDSGDTIVTESTPVPETGPRQQVEVCRRWEAAFQEMSTGIDRTVLLRPGIAIGGVGDPATRQLTRLARFGLAGPVGSGRQWVSWIGADDFFGVLYRSVVDDSMCGLYHLTAPDPVPNRELMDAYRRAVGRSIGLPSPSLVAKLGARLLGSDPALPLTGRRCIPERLINEGYEFATTDIHDAVQRAVHPR